MKTLKSSIELIQKKQKCIEENHDCLKEKGLEKNKILKQHYT